MNRILRFLTTSAIATGIDFCIYVLFCLFYYPPVANLISHSIGMIVNYTLQRRYVFHTDRSISLSFMLSLVFSGGGVLLGTVLIYCLIQIEFFNVQPLFAKIVTIVMIFFYNYTTKKIAFGDCGVSDKEVN